jgi:hypothetical protein
MSCENRFSGSWFSYSEDAGCFWFARKPVVDLGVRVNPFAWLCDAFRFIQVLLEVNFVMCAMELLCDSEESIICRK